MCLFSTAPSRNIPVQNSWRKADLKSIHCSQNVSGLIELNFQVSSRVVWIFISVVFPQTIRDWNTLPDSRFLRNDITTLASYNRHGMTLFYLRGRNISGEGIKLGPMPEIRDQTLSAEYCYQTCMYRAEILIKCRLYTLLRNAYKYFSWQWYSHDGRADKNPYPHDRRADKDSYPHDSNNQCII